MAVTSQYTIEDARRSNAAGLTRTQVAQIAHVDPRTIDVAIKEGHIPAVRLGRRVIIPRERFLALFLQVPSEEPF